ncbi:hypothetical protein BH11BAC6_BH11BAC6_04350 [soil metagenome]
MVGEVILTYYGEYGIIGDIGLQSRALLILRL